MKKIAILIILLLNYFISIFGSIIIYYNKYSFDFNYSEKLFLYSILAGLLGSIVYMTRGFYQSVAEGKDSNRSFDFDKWIWWYLFRPILGIIAGGIAFFIVYLAFDLEQSLKNQVAIYLVGFLSGYNFHDFIEKKIAKKIDLTN